jgi:hypothetical protein
MMGEIMKRAGVKPMFAVSGADGRPVVGIETHTFRDGGVTIVALMTNPQLRVDELGPPEFRSNERFAKPMTVNLTLPIESFVYDMRAAKQLGKRQTMSLTVQPYEPTVLAISPAALPDLTVAASERVQQGHDMTLALGAAGPSPADVHILHVDVTDPSGKLVEYYSGNLLARAGCGSKTIPIAANDATGKWQVRVRDVLTGDTKTAAFEVF